jgi:hypothetical protein
MDQTLGELSREAIDHVTDRRARNTLEQAHALARGLAEIFLRPDESPTVTELAVELGGLGLGIDDAEQIVSESVALLEMLAERDRKAEIFHAAVMAASESERALYERIGSYTRLLRSKLGARAPALEQLGVPPESVDTIRCNGRSGRDGSTDRASRA